MRKSLLIIASLCMSASGFAQTWTKPVPAGTDMVVGDTLYLYNVGAKAFLIGANSWTTRASVSADAGYKVVISEGKQDGCYTIGDFVERNNSGALNKMSSLDCGGFDNIWVDGGGRDGDGMWKIEKGAEGYYTITNENVPDGNFGVAEYVQGVTGKTECWILDLAKTYDSEDESGDALTKPYFEGAWDKWAFVSMDEYNKVIAGLKAYSAAEQLKKALDEAKEKYPSVDFSAVEAVYNNTESTAEQLNEAQENIQKIVVEYLGGQLTSATLSDPRNATGYITNPSFETGDLTGWTVDKKNANGKGDSSDVRVAENSNSTYHCDNADGDYLFNIWSWGNPITQTVKELPEGIYSLEAMVASSDDCNNVYITADGGFGEEHHAIALEEPKQTGGTRGSFMFPAKGDITIGAVGCDGDGTSYIKGGVWWYKVDDFRLTYYGQSDEAYKEWASKYVEDMTVYDEETPATTSLKNAYNEAAENIKNGETKADIVAAYETISSLGDSLAANVKAYDTLLKKIDEWTETAENGGYNGDKFYSFVDFVDPNSEEDVEGWPVPTAGAIINGNYSLETKDIDAYIETVEKLLKEAIAASVNEGDDCTSMLVNPAWTDANGKGWTEVSGKCNNKAFSAGLTAFPVAESYHSIFDFQQVVEGVHDGIYSISLNGFCRLDGSETEVPAEIYMNEFATPLMNLNDGGLTDTPEDGVNCYITADSWKNNETLASSTASGSGNVDKTNADGNYIPDGMVGASVAFSADRYKATAYGLVQGGKMTIGVRNLKSTSVWALWSNFKLTYEGKNAEALQNVISSTVSNIEEYKEANTDLLDGNKAGEDITALSEKLVKAYQGGNVDEMWNALIDGNRELASIKEYVALYATYVDAIDRLSTAASEYGETASDEALADYEKYSNVDASNLDKAELQALVDNIELTICELRVPKADGASDESPVEMTSVISNPSFEKDGAAASDGWTWNTKASGDTGVKDNSNDTYTIDRADGSYVFNTWNKDAVEGGYWLKQTLKALPAGTYKLTAIVASDANNKIAIGANEKYGNEITLNTPKEEASDIETVFVVEEGQTEVEIKVASDTWFKADNFQLWYYGKNSSNQPTGIEGAEAADSEAAAVSITTLNGVKVNSLVKGINIITKANGEKVKVYVK